MLAASQVASETFARLAKVFFTNADPRSRSASAKARRFQSVRRSDMPQSKIRRYLKHGTLPQLSAFEAVARHGNFTRAAEELHMAQPTVSVHIKKLSETVGLLLFTQCGRRVQLTDAGLRMQAACTEIFALLTRTEEALSQMREKATALPPRGD
jgi:DNA-binding MarR family transcriptional regulator